MKHSGKRATHSARNLPLGLATETRNGTIAESDLRAIVRLLGDVIALRGGHDEKRQLLLDGLCEIVGATNWIRRVAEKSDLLSIQKPRVPAFGGEDEAAIVDASSANPPVLAPQVACHYPVDADACSLIILWRPYGAPDFTKRESLIAHTVLSNVSWVHLNNRPAPQDSLKLSRREREVLRMLMSGNSRKLIAAELNISPNTVHGYAKSLYRRLDVKNRTELIQRAVSNQIDQ